MTVNRLDNFLQEKKRKEKGNLSGQKNMQLYSLEGYKTMCGMRPNADKLVAFCRGLDFLIGVETVGENTQMLEKSCLSSRFGFILIFTKLQTTNANVEHFFRGTFYNFCTLRRRS